MWDLPRSGIEPVSPALAGNFFTTGPPGSPQVFFFLFPLSFLQWPIGFLVAHDSAPGARWVAWRPGSDEPEEGFPGGAWQHRGLSSPGWASAPKWMPQVSMPPRWEPVTSCLSQRLFKNSWWVQPGSFQTTACALGLEHVRFCVCPLRVVSLLPVALWLSWK